MKILFVVSSYYPDGAGAGTSVRNLAEGAYKNGHHVVVMRISRDGRKYQETINGVKIYYYPIRNIYNLGGRQRNTVRRIFWHILDLFNPFAAWDFYRLLKKEKPDIINTSVISGFSTSLFYVAKLMHIRLVHTLRDYYLVCPQSGMFKNGRSCEKVCAQCKPFTAARKPSLKCVDLFLANSGFVEQCHRRHNVLPKDKPCLVQFNMNADDAVAPPRRFPAGRGITFGFIGRLTVTKGVDVLLEAAMQLKAQDWRLKIAGDGDADYIARLKKEYTDERISYVGYADADAFYQDIDVLVCPSLYEEPLPRVVYEAYRAALPVIVARTGGTPEIVDAGENGFIYDAYDTKKLAEYMDLLASQPAVYERLSRGAAEKAKLFTCSAIAAAFIAKLEAVLGKKSLPAPLVKSEEAVLRDGTGG